MFPSTNYPTEKHCNHASLSVHEVNKGPMRIILKNSSISLFYLFHPLDFFIFTNFISITIHLRSRKP
jgi:hypothetical protein